MRPAPFEYEVVKDIDGAISLLSRFGDDAKIIAGGQSLVPLLNFRLARPHYLVDINGLHELDGISENHDGLTIGAMTRQRAIEQSPVVRERCPMLAEAIRHVGHRQTRSRGTIGGSLAHADPAAELPAVVTALGGRLRVRGPSKERSLTPDMFFQSILTTALQPDEILLAVDLPDWPKPAGACFCEFSRRHGDFAVVGTGAIISLDKDARVERVGLSLMGVGPRPFDASATATAMLKNERPDEPVLQAVAERISADVQPESDMHAPADYRRHLVKVLCRQALFTAAKRALTASRGL